MSACSFPTRSAEITDEWLTMVAYSIRISVPSRLPA